MRGKTVVKISALWYNNNADDARIAKSATKSIPGKGCRYGGIAQLVRALASHARGRRFESYCLYQNCRRAKRTASQKCFDSFFLCYRILLRKRKFLLRYRMNRGANIYLARLLHIKNAAALIFHKTISACKTKSLCAQINCAHRLFVDFMNPINGYLYNEGYTADRAKLIVLSAM